MAGVDQFTEHFLSIYIAPEVEERKRAGRLPDNFAIENLYAAQVIFNAEEAPCVRLNAEVKYRVVKDQMYSVTDSGQIDPTAVKMRAKIVLTDDDPNASHLTLIRQDGRWHFTLDFVKNAQRIRQYADIAGEFLTCAEGAHERKHWRAFVDNLDAAVEGLAKARLLFHADTLDVTRSATHNFPLAQFNLARRTDPSLDHFAELYNWLRKNRGRARYDVAKPFALDDNRATSMLATARQMMHAARARSADATVTPGSPPRDE